MLETYCMSKKTENKKLSKNGQLILKSGISPKNNKVNAEEIV